ncbi:hypothetical protein VTL71DRAFT_16445 [Oculimacula yallundae]|uniref:Thioesterase domain-containing protein n=1 Tax=Oculimacula yallundae TaxID=86028 RepID=A0ABR4CEG6_9HELO
MSQNPSSSYTTALTQGVLAVPLSQTLGLSLVSQTSSPQPEALLTLTTTPLHLIPNAQTLHGGISTLLIDTACYIALIPTLSEGQTAATIASSFQILDAVRGVGKVYEIEGRVVRMGRKVVFCEGSVKCEGRIVARGNVTKVVKGGSRF